MPLIAREGDSISHGGSIIEGSPDVYAEARAVARVGDQVLCSLHGLVAITSGAATVYANGRLVAVDGSLCSCGAQVIASGNVRVEDGA